MATIAFPRSSDTVKLTKSGVTYTYVYIPAKTPKPTILFLHGFPSSSYDWRHQIAHFSSLGYGILVPDLLGYGGTDAPHSPAGYTGKAMSSHIAGLLSHLSLSKVHGAGHDFGSWLLSKLINWHPDVLLSATFVAVPYYAPGQEFNLDEMKTLTEKVLGFEKFGYMRFWSREDSADVLDAHAESFFSLVYVLKPSSIFWPAGACEEFITAEKRLPLPSYVTAEEAAMRAKIFSPPCYRGPTNWYRSLISGFDSVDEKGGLDPMIPVPTLMIDEALSDVTIPGQAEGVAQFAKDFTYKQVSTDGHWVQLEAKDEVNSFLGDFLSRFE